MRQSAVDRISHVGFILYRRQKTCHRLCCLTLLLAFLIAWVLPNALSKIQLYYMTCYAAKICRRGTARSLFTFDLVLRGTQPCLVDPALPRVMSTLLYLSGAASLVPSSIVLFSLLLTDQLGFDQEGCGMTERMWQCCPQSSKYISHPPSHHFRHMTKTCNFATATTMKQTVDSSDCKLVNISFKVQRNTLTLSNMILSAGHRSPAQRRSLRPEGFANSIIAGRPSKPRRS